MESSDKDFSKEATISAIVGSIGDEFEERTCTFNGRILKILYSVLNQHSHSEMVVLLAIQFLAQESGGVKCNLLWSKGTGDFVCSK